MVLIVESIIISSEEAILSQEEVYFILKELGGTASSKEIADRAKQKFPTLSLWSYVNKRLLQLEKKGYVQADRKGLMNVWKIIKAYP
jgi:hypothetical protein